ncbi:hypothetical protein LTR37_007098 [Vermiconidia calcicola]|uniref:Uncharacterized protein n=1 Tax=Vermiconidia calcicola TaxID=1690605 RepID=A0ACC3NF08_9PEZI|nr:hypothetical protein LTR37_007098 [Vermiconidia calcicola]
MTKVLIFGAGAVGCVYGYILHKAGATITAVCRTNYDVVKERGIHIRSKIFGECHYNPSPTRTVAEAASNGPFDYIVVASKAFPGTAEMIREAVTPEHTAIVLAQNGIGIEEDYARLYPHDTIITGVVYLPVTQVEPGVVEMGPLERFEIGTYPAKASPAAKARTQRLSELWKAGGATAPVFDDVQPVRWVKVAINASWNPICALTLCDDANYIRSSGKSEEMVRKIMFEVGRVATAEGYPDAITDEVVARDLERPRSRLATGGKEPSMLTDVRARRPIEVEAILGNTLRIAQRHNLSTPYIELLYTLAKARNYQLQPDDQWRDISFARVNSQK